MKTDVSIHFTIRGQKSESIIEKINNCLSKLPFDFSEQTDPRSVLHHCFLPEEAVKEKGFSNELCENVLHPLSDTKVCWYGASGEGLGIDRLLMLENIKKIGGVSIFVGEIKDGVKEEYEICQSIGVDCILIP